MGLSKSPKPVARIVLFLALFRSREVLCPCDWPAIKEVVQVYTCQSLWPNSVFSRNLVFDKHVSFSVFHFFKSSPEHMCLDFRERGKGRGGGRENGKNIHVREKLRCCLAYGPWPRIGPWPRHVPWLGIKPTISWFTGNALTNRTTQPGQHACILIHYFPPPHYWGLITLKPFYIYANAIMQQICDLSQILRATKYVCSTGSSERPLAIKIFLD